MTSQTQESQLVNMRDIFTVLFKHKRKILLVFFGIVSTVTIGSFVMPPTYEADSTLIVKMGREYIYRSEVGTDNPAVSFDQARVIKSEIQILSSRDLAKRVIETIGVGTVYPNFLSNSPSHMTPLDASIREMQDNLYTSEVKDSNVIKVSFQHEIPDIATNIVNLLVNFLLEKHLEVFSNPQAAFLEKQAIIYQEKLHASQSRFQEFKHQHGLFSLLEEQRLLLEQRRDLDASLKEIQNQRKGLASKLSSFKSQITRVPERTPVASVSEQQRVIDDAVANLLQLRIKEQKLLTQYKETNRLVRNIKSEIATVQRFIEEQEVYLTDKVTTGKNPVYQEMEIEIHKSESELRSLETQVGTVTQHLKQLDMQLAKLDKLENELETLQLQAESDQQNYRMYLAKVEEAKVSEKMDQLKMANISVIQQATIPVKPIKPHKMLNILLSIILGGLFALFIAFMSEFIQGGFTRPEHASRDIGLPILMSIRCKD